MTEGNITAWKVQEGDSYAAGDVLLEIETDKAQMDVEAQDDGIMAKISQPAGSKGVKVGSRIAVTADPEDDLKQLDLSSLASSSATPPPKDSAKKDTIDTDTTPARASPEGDQAAHQDSKPAKKADGGSAHNIHYPMFPSVIQLIHERGISEEDSKKIQASGPNGRLLKGDVLAYLGEIKASYSRDQEQRIKQLGHLDLSNIEIAPPVKRPEATETEQKSVEDARPAISEVTLPISLSAVETVRQRIKSVLGVEISIETFIARATQLCNDDLPQSQSRPLSADELFDSVLGLDQLPVKPRGPALIPQIQAFAVATTSPTRTVPKADLIDELAGTSLRSARSVPGVKGQRSIDPSVSMFTVSVDTGDEKRARVFLERLKTVLQVEPGRLVL